ncbi:flavodoxin [Clostridium estertheticum]|uniref:flavodoxin n=1 Tax=Clostridium estertheticum TaxID=238834 RepID=UPI001C0C59DE|nr:flavodoxin [Clostridium estertheticum]MBU3202410.1 flavodoxin [Clostridium estertheticum]WAG66621.1 flavodoxin [Clostridium estertheticum]
MDLKNKKVLIAYFSHAGENYVNGAMKRLEIGNSKVAARMISEITGGELFFIDTKYKYPDNHMEKINIAKKELQEKKRPELTEKVSNMEEYDIVFLCYPNWWGTCPMAVFSFLEEYDFAGKTIAPLCTHEGSGLSNSVKDIAKVCPEAIVVKGFAVQGGRISSAKDIIRNWIQTL